MSSGSFWRSPSIVTITSPRARRKPACIAGCWPKLRLKRTPRTRGSASWRASIRPKVPSVEPSSTKSELEAPAAARARRRCAGRAPRPCRARCRPGRRAERLGPPSGARARRGAPSSSVSATARAYPAGARPASGGPRWTMAALGALAETVDELRLDRRHGGSWAARLAVEALAATADAVPASTSEELLERLAAGARELAASRPGLVAVAGALGRLLAAARSASHLPVEELRRLVQAEAQGARRRPRPGGARDRDPARASGSTVPSVPTHSASATVRGGAPPRLAGTRALHRHRAARGRAACSPTSSRRAGVDAEVVDDADGPRTRRAERTSSSSAPTPSSAAARSRTRSARARSPRRPRAAGIPTIVACEVIKLAPVDRRGGRRARDGPARCSTSRRPASSPRS